MKRFIPGLLALLMVLGLSARGGGSDASRPEDIEDGNNPLAIEAPPEEETEPADTPGSAAEPETEDSEGVTERFVLYEYEANGSTVSHDMLAQAGMDDTWLELYPDGTGKLSLFESLLDITWVDGTITVYGTSEYTYEIDGDTLYLDMQGVNYVMSRDADAAEPAEEPEAEPIAEVEEPSEAAADPDVIPQGDGIVSEEQVQKAYVWLNRVAKDVFHMTYGELAAYFGTDGLFDKEEFSEHMQVNKRYYKWVSAEDDTHFLYVNFEEDEPGVFTVSSYNTSGFDGAQAVDRYLETVEEEARQADIAAAANAVMTDFSVELRFRSDQEDGVTVSMQIPESGWSYDEQRAHLVDSDDIYTFGAGFIQFKLEDDAADFDFYKEDFENYQEIAPRTIGGVEMTGRTYENIGYEWTEYIAQLDEGRAISIGVVRLDLAEGTMADRILESVQFR